MPQDRCPEQAVGNHRLLTEQGLLISVSSSHYSQRNNDSLKKPQSVVFTMNWSIVHCQYEGGGYGEKVPILVETDTIDDAHTLIRDNASVIPEFVEHSIQEEYMWDVNSHPSFSYSINSEEDVRSVLSDPFNPDYAIFADGSVMVQEYVNSEPEFVQ